MAEVNVFVGNHATSARSLPGPRGKLTYRAHCAVCGEILRSVYSESIDGVLLRTIARQHSLVGAGVAVAVDGVHTCRL